MIYALPPVRHMRAGRLTMRTHDPLIHIVMATDSSGLAMWLFCDIWATSVADRMAAPPGACPTYIRCVGHACRS